MRHYTFALVLFFLPVTLHAFDGESGTSKLRNKTYDAVERDDLLPEKIRLRLDNDFSFVQTSYETTTHVGILRYICRYVSRYYGNYLRNDRDSYSSMSLHPYYAEKRYDRMLSSVSRRLKIEAPKESNPYFLLGRLSLGRDMRLRFHDSSRIRVYRRFLLARTSPSLYRTRFRLRARINVKLRNSSFGLKTIGVKMNGVFVDKKGKKLPINIFVTAKHKLSDSSTVVFVGISV